MKILHAAETIKGGIASYLEEVLPYQLSALGQGNVLVLVPQDHITCLPDFTNNLVTFCRKFRSVIGFWNFTIKFIDTLKRENPDVVLFHSTFAGFFGRLVLFFYPKKIKVLYCPHGWSFAMKTSFLKNRIYCVIEKILANYATNKIVCVSKHEYSLARKAGIKESKLTLIYNGITPPTKNTYSKNPNTNRPLEILFVGRFDYAKGFDILLEAVKGIDKKIYNLTIIGGAVDGNYAVEIPSHINNLGWMDRQKVFEYLCKTDVLIMPSRWEGFSMLALEAMACGTAIFASSEASLPEQVDAGFTGELFDIANIKLLSELIINADIQKLHKMGQLGREKYLHNFTAKIMNEKIMELVKNVG